MMLECMSYDATYDDLRKQLEQKCQENGWLKHDGYVFEGNPYLEAQPYIFLVAKTVGELRDYFQEEGHNIREGVVYDDLAFINQVDGDDVWWVLKQSDHGWVDVESLSFKELSQYPELFARYVVSMQMATPEQCQSLEYMIPSDDYTWEAHWINDMDFEGNEIHQRIFEASKEGYQIVIAEDLNSSDRYNAIVYRKESDEEMFYKTGCTALEGAVTSMDKVDQLIETEHRTDGAEWRDVMQGLETRANTARQTAQIYSQAQDSHGVEDREFAVR